MESVDVDRLERERDVDGLIAALHDAGSEIREAVARSLGRVGDPRGVEALTELRSDWVWAVQRAAVEALEQIEEVLAKKQHLIDQEVAKEFQAATATEGSIRDALVAKLEYLDPVPLAAAKEFIRNFTGTENPLPHSMDEVIDLLEGLCERDQNDFGDLVTRIGFDPEPVPNLGASYEWGQGVDEWGTGVFLIVRVEEGGFLWDQKDTSMGDGRMYL